MKKHSGETWMPGDAYGRSLPVFTINLIVSSVARSVAFYRDVLGVTVVYFNEDFAALRLSGVDFMLHADHTYDHHAWHAPLLEGARRGLGAELRAFGIDPDAVERRAREAGAAIVQAASDKPHGWREVMVSDPDGYVWAVGTAIGQ
jgi:catechol 2,3-dioxygenase-like lactoylglutathione lyase family enzyme